MSDYHIMGRGGSGIWIWRYWLFSVWLYWKQVYWSFVLIYMMYPKVVFQVKVRENSVFIFARHFTSCFIYTLSKPSTSCFTLSRWPCFMVHWRQKPQAIISFPHTKSLYTQWGDSALALLSQYNEVGTWFLTGLFL